jgi:hypothetical protein
MPYGGDIVAELSLRRFRFPQFSASRYPIDRYTLRNRYFLRPSFVMMA